MVEKRQRAERYETARPSCRGCLCLCETTNSVVVYAIAVRAHLVAEGGEAGVERIVIRAINLEAASNAHSKARHVSKDHRTLA